MVLVVTCKDGKEARDMPGIVSLFVSVPCISECGLVASTFRCWAGSAEVSKSEFL